MSSLVRAYVLTNPVYRRVKKLMSSTFGVSPSIDHVAIRTRTPTLLPTVQAVLKNSVLQPETYTFPSFQATARWYKLPDSMCKRLFLTTYQGTNLPSIASPADYNRVCKQNPFLAWTTLFEQHINHIALEVPDIEKATEACILEGISMNTEGTGLYKVSKDGLLIQTATMSVPTYYTFENGETQEVPYTFVELVQRKRDTNGVLRDGFEQENALHIFSSTTGTT
jgi:hypothetical protein